MGTSFVVGNSGLPVQGLGPVVTGPGFFGGILPLVLLLGLIALIVIVVVANRAEPDSTGRRPFVVYLFGVAFVTLWLALVSSTVVAGALFQLIGSHPQMLGAGSHPVGDAVARAAVFGGIITMISVAVLMPHLRRGLALSSADGTSAKRVAQSYVSAVAFIAVLAAIVGLIVTIYAIFQIIAPGIFHAGGATAIRSISFGPARLLAPGKLPGTGAIHVQVIARSGGRIPTLRYLLTSLYFMLAATIILRGHLRLVPPDARPWRRFMKNSGGTDAAV